MGSGDRQPLCEQVCQHGIAGTDGGFVEDEPARIVARSSERLSPRLLHLPVPNFVVGAGGANQEQVDVLSTIISRQAAEP